MASHYISGRLQWLGLVLALVLAPNTNPNQLDHRFIQRISKSATCMKSCGQILKLTFQFKPLHYTNDYQLDLHRFTSSHVTTGLFS